MKRSLFCLLAMFVASAVWAADVVTGTLSAKPDTAAADVVAVLLRKAPKGEPELAPLNLKATGDVAKSLADLVAKQAKVQLEGTTEGDAFTVTSVTEAPAAGKKKGDKGKGKGKKKKKTGGEKPGDQ